VTQCRHSARAAGSASEVEHGGLVTGGLSHDDSDSGLGCRPAGRNTANCTSFLFKRSFLLLQVLVPKEKVVFTPTRHKMIWLMVMHVGIWVFATEAIVDGTPADTIVSHDLSKGKPVLGVESHDHISDNPMKSAQFLQLKSIAPPFAVGGSQVAAHKQVVRKYVPDQDENLNESPDSVAMSKHNVHLHQRRQNSNSSQDLPSSVARLIGDSTSEMAYVAGDQKCVLQYLDQSH
jgi:hypothetical protein